MRQLLATPLPPRSSATSPPTFPTNSSHLTSSHGLQSISTPTSTPLTSSSLPQTHTTAWTTPPGYHPTPKTAPHRSLSAQVALLVEIQRSMMSSTRSQLPSPTPVTWMAKRSHNSTSTLVVQMTPKSPSEDSKDWVSIRVRALLSLLISPEEIFPTGMLFPRTGLLLPTRRLSMSVARVRICRWAWFWTRCK